MSSLSAQTESPPIENFLATVLGTIWGNQLEAVSHELEGAGKEQKDLWSTYKQRWKTNCSRYQMRCVWVASNTFWTSPTFVVTFYNRKDNANVLVQQPSLIHKYNKSRGGVDCCDQNMSCYRISTKQEVVVGFVHLDS